MSNPLWVPESPQNEKNEGQKSTKLCASDRVYASLGGAAKFKELPPPLRRAWTLEQSRAGSDFVVAYHILPDANKCTAIVLYEFYAEIANLVHKVEVPVLPRLLRRHFSERWSKVSKFASAFKNDHVRDWINVGLSCSASLFSQTEAPPYSHFAKGYKGGADYPNHEKLMEDVLLQYKCPGADAKALANLLATQGETIFGSVGGSLLQIFLREDLAKKYIYLADAGPSANCCTVMSVHGEKVLDTMRTGNLDNMQIRLIAHPDVLLDPTKATLFHYRSSEEDYAKAKLAFQTLIRENIEPFEVGSPGSSAGLL